MGLKRKELVLAAVVAAVMLVFAGPRIVGGLLGVARYASASETVDGLPEEGKAVNADAEWVQAKKAAEKFAAARRLTILETVPVAILERGNLKSAVLVAFRGNKPAVYCFADGHCRPPKD